MKLVSALLVTCCLTTSQAKAVIPNHHQNTDTDREITVPESIVSSLNTAIKNVPKIIPHSVMPILPDIAAILAHVVTSNLPNSSNKKTDKLLRSSDEAAQLGLPEVLEQLNIPIPASVEATLQETFGKLFNTFKRPADSTQDELPAALREIEVILPNGAENFVNMAILSLYDAIPQSLLQVVPNIVAIAMHLGNPNSNMRSDSSPDGSDKMFQLRLPAASREWKFTLPNSTEAAIANLHPNIAESVVILQPAAEAAVTAIVQLLAGNASPLDN